jgi:polyisoprenoid-binding protein YceI
VKGRFGAATGTVSTDGDDFATAEVEVSIDAASLDTREPARDTHLRSADFFDVQQFPAITFKSRTVRPQTGHGRYTVAGDLTIRGISREIALDVTTEGFVRDPWGHEKAGFSAVGHLNRKDFGLTWNVALETGGVLVGDEVKLHLDVELTKKG